MPATPYDPAKTRQLLLISGAHSSNPAAEYIDSLVEQLKAAEDELATAGQARRKAEDDANRYASDLTTAQRTIRELRDGNGGYTEMLDTLKAIARNPKGAKQIAAETVAKINGTPVAK